MLTKVPVPYRKRLQRRDRRLAQARKGVPLPPDRYDDAILTPEWLTRQLGRPLQPSEAQTFGRMALDEWTRRHGTTYRPYTMRIGEENSQRTVYLPEDTPILFAALERYRRSHTYQRAASIRKGEHHEPTT